METRNAKYFEEVVANDVRVVGVGVVACLPRVVYISPSLSLSLSLSMITLRDSSRRRSNKRYVY